MRFTAIALFSFAMLATTSLRANDQASLQANTLAARALASERSIGINLDFHGHRFPQILFVDVFKQSLPWTARPVDDPAVFNSGVEVPLDDNGWPERVPFVNNGSDPQVAQTIFLDSLEGRYPGGTYTLRLEGQGRVTVDGDAAYGSYLSPGTYEVEVTPSNEGIFLEVLESNEMTPISSIEFIMPGHASTALEQPFNPQLLEFLRPFSVIRTSQITATNDDNYGCDNGFAVDSPFCERIWNGRVTKAYATQGGPRGVAFEYLVDLANTLECDLWLNVLHATTDSYVDSLAACVAGNLDDGRAVYLELSNEVWNDSGSFPQHNFYINRGNHLGWTGTGSIDTGRRYFTRRWVEVAEAFESAFCGGDNTLVKVLPSFSDGPDLTERYFEHLADPLVNPNGTLPDAVAIAAYLGVLTPLWLHNALDAGATQPPVDTSATQMLTWLAQNVRTDLPNPWDPSDLATSIPTMLSWHQSEVTAALQQIPVIAYEGGQHLAQYADLNHPTAITDSMMEANTREEMAAIYLDIFAAWFENNGGTFVSYTNLATSQSYASFGIAEYLGQPLTEAHKLRAHYQAIADWVSSPSLPLRDYSFNLQNGNTVMLHAQRPLAEHLMEVSTSDLLPGTIYQYSHDLEHWETIPFFADFPALGESAAVLPFENRIFFRVCY